MPITPEHALERLRSIVADLLDIEHLVLSPATAAADVPGWDSLAHIQIIVAVERAFGIRFRTGEIASIANVGELVQRIVTRQAEK